MEPFKIDATIRTGRGKNFARQLRREGRIPAVAYGSGMEALSLAISPTPLLELLHGKFGRNSVVELRVEGKSPLTALVSDYEYDPVTRELKHADFLHVKMDRPIDVDAPLVLKGRALGVIAGGTLQQFFKSLPLKCTPATIPQVVEHDVSSLDKGQFLTVADLQLPAGVSVRLPGTQRLATIPLKSRAAAEDEAAAEGAAPGGKAAAPAKAAAKPAGGKS